MQKPKGPVDMRPGRAGQQLMLRLPETLRDRIKVAADRNARSLNAEIVATLLVAYPEPQDPVEALIEQVRELAVLAKEGTVDLPPLKGETADSELEEMILRLRQEVRRRAADRAADGPDE